MISLVPNPLPERSVDAGHSRLSVTLKIKLKFPATHVTLERKISRQRTSRGPFFLVLPGCSASNTQAVADQRGHACAGSAGVRSFKCMWQVSKGKVVAFSARSPNSFEIARYCGRCSMPFA